MVQGEKIRNALLEIERMRIEIMGLSEMSWPDASYCDIEGYRVYYSRSTQGKYEHGVGFIVNKDVVGNVTNFAPLNERSILLQLNKLPVNTNIIQVYALTSDHSEEIVEEFYTKMENLIKKLPKQELLILIGDLNTKIGKGSAGKHTGTHELGIRNERADTLSTFAART